MNLALSLLYAAERTPDAEAVVQGETRFTYAALQERVARLAGGLAGEGLGRGDRLAAVVRCRHESAQLYWACQWLGATFVPLSPRVSAADIAYCREDSGARLFLEVDIELEGLLGAEHPGALDLPDTHESLMLYTSGTTGRPKGVPRSHRADRAGGLSQVVHQSYRYGDRTLGCMPLYHTMGIHSLISMHLIGGCYVCQPEWDAEAALGLIERERITSLYLAPTLYHDLVWHPRFGDYDVSSVETLAYAGAAMTSALVERCAEAFSPRLFLNHYGSTEIYTFSVQRDQRAKPGCAGGPALNARLRLAGNGEILCHMSSDEAFAGYWNRPEADEKAIRDGWYHTGDVGRLDEDGDLWLEGRLDDMIISGGENVHPLEVEDVLARHPRVREVAVVGAPDDRLGQRVVAYVVADGELEAGELDAHCLSSDALARFKRPREYRFVDELPKSPSGKILRRMLREDEVTA
ncbi:MAG TPA: AMP-binding protein [Gaiellaceae bacterium]|nr:AMP-binding protein [Gaiellaceae bacterium]